MKVFKYLFFILVSFSIACSNTDKKETVIKRYFYKSVTKYDSNPEKEHLDFYSIIDAAFIKDSIFTFHTLFDKDFEIIQECEEAFIIKGGELYLVNSNGTRLYFSIQTNEPVVYFGDPYFSVTNNLFGRIHWYMGTDTIMTSEFNRNLIRHKFFVINSVPYLEEELPHIQLEKTYYLNSEAAFYHYYDKDFILISTEPVNKRNEYREKHRIKSFGGFK